MRPDSVRLQIRSSLSISTSKLVAEHDAAQPLHLAAERVDIAQPGGVTVSGHHRTQQLRGARPPVHP